ncbi:reverse transcriptase domain-containing protein [Tuwongella immobilis]|uniref:RNA-directed DNA polymerase n=1 Tax=Tuwongella immobilis TaxID=692036 RepID=A0A6C2YRT4_9BACT|nr:reverse transcriptase domain-containing protein [Tuwongella immobilis]VIP03869.1 rna-directed dna polymerase : Reverse transcriptase (RNA-dependent DNA polymerase) OS=Singulisphaera acidiphila (strain ATCC BAA-1392 / DSM 18658 / VKM B-2454 / MOB10) GN=Sinac_4396 PE=4 SV=1: RVT_1 [Tuwongella immobilis]VTS05105.1 rna-directed dna polymerase : Reverse transcriptase (RNA-dependent DNA polymerase) OS=Singulisphaera acidiphila (strain ATCC BAA-1392 / DSM 18658 / VKM B-2454 / MOB10) GN=Sinac_4396 PE=
MNPLERLLEFLGFTKTEADTSKPAKGKPAPADAKSAAGGSDASGAKKPSGPAVAKTFNLDASDLLPITSEELKSGLRKLLRSGGFRFVGRGMIPHGDERTRLINRALLSEGFLTAEQLEAITQVAVEFEELQKALARIEGQVNKSAKKAVEADKEEKARIKAQKKAEALAKKQKHAADVAHRRETDIIFLGRKVSAKLNDRKGNAELLAGYGLPAISTPAELAAALGLSVAKLRWLAFHTEVATRMHYVQFQIPKKSGGTRLLSAPHQSLAAAQEWIYREIIQKIPVETPAHGFVTGRSIVTNAQPHVGNPVLINMDLEAFFPTITWQRVRSVFHRAGYSPSVATILALICTECPRDTVEYAGKTYYVATGPRGLPQGACTSPGLSNLVARRLDKRLGGLCGKLGLTYTRYADDLSVSGPAEINEKVGYLMARIRHIAEAEGFQVNPKKTRVLRPNTAQLVTGIVVNAKPSLPKKELRRLRAILHQAQKNGLDAQNREQIPHFRAWLAGKISFVRMVRPELGAKLQAQFDAL